MAKLGNLIDTLNPSRNLPDLNDPTRIPDPDAINADWSPLSPTWGANFLTHQLAATGPGRLEFQATKGVKIMAAAFIFVGLAAAGGFGGFAINEGLPITDFLFFFPLLFGASFVGVGIFAWKKVTGSTVFDKKSGMYTGAKQDSAALAEIHALQLLGKWAGEQKEPYPSYELIVVLKDGRRMLASDHGKLERQQEDANTLARFLGVPIWDGVSD